MPVEQTVIDNQRQYVVHTREPPDETRTASNHLQNAASETDGILPDDYAEDPEAPITSKESHPSGDVDTSKEPSNDAATNVAGPPSWCERVTVEPMIFLFNVATMLASPVQTDLYLMHACRGTLGYNESTCATLEGGRSEALEVLVQPHASVFIMWAR